MALYLPLRTRAGAVNTTLTYDAVSRPATVFHNLAGTSGDITFGYGYNAASQIVSRSRSNDGYVYGGDVAVARHYSVNGLNQYVSAGGASFGYDANGNLTSDGASSYVYDVENRLVSASGATSASLRYDPLGRLYETSGGSAGITRFLYDGDELVGEYNSAGTTLRRYAHGPGSDDPLIWYEGSTMGTTNRRVLLTDHQGSIVSVANDTGALVTINRYDDWGVPDASNAGRFQYTGQAWIPELNMYHYKARIYSPTLGRFMQTDPIGYDDGPHLYAYVGNDPVNGVDPTGTRLEYLDKENQEDQKKLVDETAKLSPDFAKRLQTLEDSEHVVYIGQGDDPKAAPLDPEGASDGTGSSTFVTINFESAIALPGKDLGGADIEADPGAQVAHELLSHAFDHVTGTNDRTATDIFTKNVSEEKAVSVENKYREIKLQPIRIKY